MWINLTEQELERIRKVLHSSDDPIADPALAARIQDFMLSQSGYEIQAYRNALPHLSESEWDIDDDAFVSAGEDGAYVMVWRWVPDEDRPL